MPGRRRAKREAAAVAEKMADKATEMKGAAREVAEDLMEAAERAAERLNVQGKHVRHRGRKVFKATLALGAAAALLANDRVREKISGLMGRGRDEETWSTIAPSDATLRQETPSTTTP